MISVLQNWDLSTFWKLLLSIAVIHKQVKFQPDLYGAELMNHSQNMLPQVGDQDKFCHLFQLFCRVTHIPLAPSSSHEPQPSTDIMKDGHSHSWRLIKQRKAASSYNPHHLAFFFVHILNKRIGMKIAVVISKHSINIYAENSRWNTFKNFYLRMFRCKYISLIGL